VGREGMSVTPTRSGPLPGGPSGRREPGERRAPGQGAARLRVLRRPDAIAAILAVLAVLALPVARAGPAGGLREPLRLTAGSANHLMGVLAPDGHTLYFVTDRHATTAILSQDVERGGPSPAVERDGDVTWPRPSPDGRMLLYISRERDATGDVCLLDQERRRHRCLTGPETADVQAFWYPDGRSVGVVQREGLHGDFRLRRIPLDGAPGEVVLARNLTAPSLVAGGRRVVFVPIGRERREVGPAFALVPASGLAFQEPGGRVVTPWQPGLPGATAFPSPSMDGRWLYFIQYLNDTNRDGLLDGNDHGVVFRVALDPDTGLPEAGALPEQLTSARWNCLYPMPARDRLLVTCSRSGSLDVYSLPLEGMVPPEWDVDRLDREAASAREDADALLLLARAAAREPDPRRRLDRLRHLARRHLERGEFVAAEHYLQALRQGLPEGDPVLEWATVMLQVTAHRDAEQRLVQGQVGERFVSSEKARLEVLEAMRPRSPDVAALVRLVRAEVLDKLGRKREALELFQSVPVRDLADPEVVHQSAVLGTHLWSLFQQREALLAFQAALSEHPALPFGERIGQAEEFVRTLTRGLGRGERESALAAALDRAERGGLLSFRLRLEAILQGLGSRDSEAVRQDLFRLYGESDADRRRIQVLVTARRAAEAGEPMLLYQFVNSWVSGLRRSDVEWPYAEGLFRQVALERGHDLLRAGSTGDARGVFFGASLILDALHPHAAFIEARRAEGHTDIEATYRKRGLPPEDPVGLFAETYLEALQFREDRAAGDPPPVEASRALEKARKVGVARPRDPQAHLLWGFWAHQAWRQSGVSDLAAEADDHYLLAADLATDDPRVRAAALQGAAELQASLGNHQIALDLAQQRLRLPFPRAEEELSMRLLRARGLFLTDRDREASEEAERALERVRGRSELAPFLPLVLDRAALYRLQAGDPEGAASLYGELLQQTAFGEGTWNRFLALRNRGAAWLAAGKAREALADLEQAAGELDRGARPPAAAPGPGGRPLPRVFTREDHRLLLLGLHGEALARLGRWEEAARVLEARREGLRTRLRARDLDEDLLELARTGHRLAEAAWHRGDFPAAARWVREGLEREAAFRQRTGTPVTAEGRMLMLDAAMLHLEARVPLDRVAPDLRERMSEALAFLGAHPSDRNAVDRFWLEVFLTRLDLSR